ncbi:LC1, partial [Symbiodinium sp. CCMP2456]
RADGPSWPSSRGRRLSAGAIPPTDSAGRRGGGSWLQSRADAMPALLAGVCKDISTCPRFREAHTDA